MLIASLKLPLNDGKYLYFTPPKIISIIKPITSENIIAIDAASSRVKRKREYALLPFSPEPLPFMESEVSNAFSSDQLIIIENTLAVVFICLISDFLPQVVICF